MSGFGFPIDRTTRSALLFVALLSGCRPAPEKPLDNAAREYVVLMLALGARDTRLVESYYGPEEWRSEAERIQTIASIDLRASRLSTRLSELAPETEEGRRRWKFLERQLAALRANVAWLRGARMDFDQQAEAFFGEAAAQRSEAELASRLETLDRLLPGEGSLLSRYGRHQQRFIVPPDKLTVVFERAITECRRRTLQHIDLPANERYRLSLVFGKPWAAYSSYLGGYESLIELNAGFALTVDAMIDLACHEGYPGHHTMQVLLESRRVRRAGENEYTILPRFSPLAAFSEGLAELGVDLVFPTDERRRFEREVLFPLAGIAQDDFELYEAVRIESKKLRAAHTATARLYLDARLGKREASRWLRDYALVADPEPALRFMQIYRSYQASYEIGERMVREYLETLPGSEWDLFVDMLKAGGPP